MRLLKLGVYHSNYLRDFYEKQNGLRTEHYAVQHQTIIDDCFGSSDFWTRAFAQLNYETTDIIANAEPLQKRWAHENNFRFNEQDWFFEIAAAQIKLFRPEILLVADYSTFTAEFLRTLKRECPSIRLVLGWCGAPYSDSSVFHEWDIALSCIPKMVSEFKRRGHRSFHVNHAFAPRILEKLDLESAPIADFSFVGSIIKRNEFHIDRENLMLELIKHTDLKIWSDLKQQSFKEQQKQSVVQKAEKMLGAARKIGIPEFWLDALPLRKRIKESVAAMAKHVDERIARRARPPVFGLEMFQTLRNSRVILNNHIDISRDSASNMRLFEATGVGTCLLTDQKDNLVELFEPDLEVLTYRSAEECREKVDYILKYENKRREIALAGQKRTLKHHTFVNRVALIDEIISNYFSSKQ